MRDKSRGYDSGHDRTYDGPCPARIAGVRTAHERLWKGTLRMDEKMGIKRLDHVCWTAYRIDDVLPLLTDLMGMTVEGRFENPEVGFRGVGLRVPGGTGHFEVLEPYDETSYLHRFLQERGPGLHHVTFEVQDIERAAKAIRGYGIEPMGGVQRSHGWAETYIHPKDSGGVLFQFYVEEEHHHHPHEDEDVSHSHEMEPLP